MANTQQVALTANFVDGDGVRTAAKINALVNPDATITEALAMLTSYLTDLVACSDAGLIGASMSIEDLTSPVGATGALDDSSVDEVGLLNFQVTASGRSFGFPIPALKDAVISAGHIVTGTGPVHTLATLISAGASGITYTAPDFLALGGLNSSFRTNRKHRRALKRASFSAA